MRSRPEFFYDFNPITFSLKEAIINHPKTTMNTTMKLFNNTIVALILFIFAAGMTACSDNSTGVDPAEESNVEVRTVEELHAPADRENPDSMPFVYFSLISGETVSAEQAEANPESWDIGIRGTEIIVNSGASGSGEAGAIMLDIPFEQVDMAPSSGYETDTEDEYAINGWYTYTGGGSPAHAVIAKEDMTIVLRTADGQHYAKMQIMSYYKNNPDYDSEEFADLGTRGQMFPSQYYTFRFATQMTEGLRELN